MEHWVIERNLLNVKLNAAETDKILHKVIHCYPSFVWEIYNKSSFNYFTNEVASEDPSGEMDSKSEEEKSEISYKDTWQCMSLIIGQYENSKVWYVKGYER